MTTIRRTPKTLVEAISDGIEDATELNAIPEMQIKKTVRDFLAQRFGAATMLAETQEEADRFKALFNRIVGESK